MGLSLTIKTNFFHLESWKLMRILFAKHGFSLHKYYMLFCVLSKMLIANLYHNGKWLVSLCYWSTDRLTDLNLSDVGLFLRSVIFWSIVPRWLCCAHGAEKTSAHVPSNPTPTRGQLYGNQLNCSCLGRVHVVYKYC